MRMAAMTLVAALAVSTSATAQATPKATGTSSVEKVAQYTTDQLKSELNLTADQIKVVSFEDKEWPDGCLGVVHMGMLCTQQIVPGFRRNARTFFIKASYLIRKGF